MNERSNEKINGAKGGGLFFFSFIRAMMATEEGVGFEVGKT